MSEALTESKRNRTDVFAAENQRIQMTQRCYIELPSGRKGRMGQLANTASSNELQHFGIVLFTFLVAPENATMASLHMKMILFTRLPAADRTEYGLFIHKGV